MEAAAELNIKRDKGRVFTICSGTTMKIVAIKSSQQGNLGNSLTDRWQIVIVGANEQTNE